MADEEARRGHAGLRIPYDAVFQSLIFMDRRHGPCASRASVHAPETATPIPAAAREEFRAGTERAGVQQAPGAGIAVHEGH